MAYTYPADDHDYSVREELDDADRADYSYARELGDTPALPAFDPRYPDESLHAYGSRVLQFLIRTECTAVLTDDDLELADHLAVFAVSAPEITGPALERVNSVRHLISALLRGRRKLADLAMQAPANTVPPAKPNEGPMAPLLPVPRVNPPAVTYGKPDVRF